MKQSASVIIEEPVGIVISRGRDVEKSPRFTAYMWAPGPEVEADGAKAA